MRISLVEMFALVAFFALVAWYGRQITPVDTIFPYFVVWAVVSGWLSVAFVCLTRETLIVGVFFAMPFICLLFPAILYPALQANAFFLLLGVWYRTHQPPMPIKARVKIAVGSATLGMLIGGFYGKAMM